MSRPAVHPVEAPPVPEGAVHNAPRGKMKDVQGMPGTLGGLALRLLQFIFAAVSLCVMSTTSDFPSVTAFRYVILEFLFHCILFCVILFDVAIVIISNIRFAAFMSQ